MPRNRRLSCHYSGGSAVTDAGYGETLYEQNEHWNLNRNGRDPLSDKDVDYGAIQREINRRVDANDYANSAYYTTLNGTNDIALDNRQFFINKELKKSEEFGHPRPVNYQQSTGPDTFVSVGNKTNAEILQLMRASLDKPQRRKFGKPTGLERLIYAIYPQTTIAKVRRFLGKTRINNAEFYDGLAKMSALETEAERIKRTSADKIARDVKTTAAEQGRPEDDLADDLLADSYSIANEAASVLRETRKDRLANPMTRPAGMATGPIHSGPPSAYDFGEYLRTLEKPRPSEGDLQTGSLYAYRTGSIPDFEEGLTGPLFYTSPYNPDITLDRGLMQRRAEMGGPYEPFAWSVPDISAAFQPSFSAWEAERAVISKYLGERPGMELSVRPFGQTSGSQALLPPPPGESSIPLHSGASIDKNLAVSLPKHILLKLAKERGYFGPYRKATQGEIYRWLRDNDWLM